MNRGPLSVVRENIKDSIKDLAHRNGTLSLLYVSLSNPYRPIWLLGFSLTSDLVPFNRRDQSQTNSETVISQQYLSHSPPLSFVALFL